MIVSPHLQLTSAGGGKSKTASKTAHLQLNSFLSPNSGLQTPSAGGCGGGPQVCSRPPAAMGAVVHYFGALRNGAVGRIWPWSKEKVRNCHGILEGIQNPLGSGELCSFPAASAKDDRATLGISWATIFLSWKREKHYLSFFSVLRALALRAQADERAP